MHLCRVPCLLPAFCACAQGTQHIGYAAEGGEDAADDNLPELRIGVMRGVTLPSIGTGSSTQRRAPKGSGNYRR